MQKAIVVLCVGFAVLTPLAVMNLSSARHEEVRHERMIYAPTYELPRGCTLRKWAVGDSISTACNVSLYWDDGNDKLPHINRVNGANKTIRWLRVGSDALMVHCLWDMFTGQCKIEQVEPDFYGRPLS
ncbi:hypothetical protein [Caulobacter sp. S45]|uniref:hypothetical protein n=1 Tax=Caulobacter sp. S45 TaxID=1641861 RepID=UPI00131C9416|nr:hypothetical protein [Caulobacter sp. S45]